MSSTDDRYQDKRLSALERQMGSVLARLEDLERAGSPDGVVYHEQSGVADTVARVCQSVRQTHGETQTDLIGGA